MKRREKDATWEVEMDLIGEPHTQNMLKQRLWGTKEAHLAVSGDYKKQEDVRLYGQLPDYDDFQGYDMGKDDIPRQISLTIC